MARVTCHAYSTGVFEGVEFREETVDGVRVGVAHTDDAAALRWFGSRRQFTVEYGDEPPAPPVDAVMDAPALETLTVAQLREYATENGIDLGNHAKKAEIVAAITEALTAADGDEGGDLSPDPEDGDGAGPPTEDEPTPE